MLRYLFWKGAGVIKGTNLLVTHARLLLCDSADSHEMSWIKAASDSVTLELSIREALSWQIGLLLYLKGPYLWFRRPFIFHFISQIFSVFIQRPFAHWWLSARTEKYKTIRSFVVPVPEPDKSNQKKGHENSKNASAEMIFESHQTEIIILKYLPSFNISLTTPTKQ